ncbi:recombination regulator RecX [Lysobacter sp. GX 14042]|uniref:recombination regulator RecX n=1 Tax=Lysobacter sp. GX 14042 TaxID=2907155 RepID=UPI001F1A0925|nr:recombination regulator RecX [Lysobacter sp. GX 14042]MCE7032689.1 recombination regulator RecX [Lysobacter sp. GX 14042]
MFEDGSAAATPRRSRRPPQTPVQRALGLLVRREHSRRELGRKLAARGVEPAEAEAAVQRLAEAGWQDDARFAESLVRQRAMGGYGPYHIRAELGTHGLDTAMVEAAMEGCEVDWLENARELARRRHGEGFELDPVRRRKAADLLARRGFPGELIRRVTRLDDEW